MLSTSLSFPLGSRHCSLPVSSPDQHSSATSPASYSSTGHGHTHTPSSGGSLTRYTSLTTPFYQVPLQRQQNIVAVHYGFTPSGGSTPTNSNMEVPQGMISYIPTGSNSQTPSVFHSNSSNRRRSDNSMQVCARSPPLPFGRLIHHHYHHHQPPSSSSLSSSPHSQSGSSLNLCRHKSNSLSPLSTPPLTNVPSPMGGGRTLGHGMKYSLTPHGSGTKLTSLVEETEKSSSSSKNGSRSKGKSQPVRAQKPSVIGDFITQSCLLNSDDEPDGDADDDDNFPLSLSLHSSIDREDGELGQQISMAMAAAETDSFQPSTHVVTHQGNDAVQFTMQSPDHIDARPASARESEHRPKSRGEKKVQRAASFSQRSHRLTHELADIRNRAVSLSAHGNPLDPNFTATTIRPGYDLEVSPSSGIVAFKLPFLFSSSGSQDLASPSVPGRTISGSLLRCGEGECEECSSSNSSLVMLRCSYLLGQELLAMAKARQGPIMLLSTELVSVLIVTC